METPEAKELLIKSAIVAQQRGAWTLEEASTINQAISVVNKSKLPQEEPKKVKNA